MNDDWRLRVDLSDEGIAHQLSEHLQTDELEHDLERRFADRVIVSVDGSELFCYAGSRAQAEAARRLIEQVAAERGWSVRTDLRCWHPEAEEWQSADLPLPGDATQAAEERAERNEDEREESEEQGWPEYEVRVTCESRRDARELSGRLKDEGIANVHRWNWVMIGVSDEDAGDALADRLHGELAGRQVSVEPNIRVAYENRPGNPLSVLGGLAD